MRRRRGLFELRRNPGDRRRKPARCAWRRRLLTSRGDRARAANVFDTAAQALAKSRLEQLARGNSCGGKNDQRCL
jgi:hypothetical protein